MKNPKQRPVKPLEPVKLRTQGTSHGFHGFTGGINGNLKMEDHMKVIKLQKTGRELEAFVTDCGRVYLPAALFGNEATILYCTAYDGAETIQADGHIYAAADWLATEFPEYRQRLSEIVRQAKKGAL